MDKELIDYLPPVVKQIREMQILMGTEQAELEKLKKAATQVLEEGFLFTQGNYGASRWEKILDLHIKGSDSLEVRNYRILEKLNARLPFTIRMLHERIRLMITDGEYQIYLVPDQYFLKVIITGQKLKELQIIRQMVEEMIPLNLSFLYAGRELLVFDVNIKLESSVTFLSEFYPRFNIPYLSFDGTWFWDGSYTLDGYVDNKKYEFYPAQLWICGKFLISKKIDSIFLLTGNAFLNTFLKSKALELFGTVSENLEENSKIELIGSATVELESTGDLTVEKDLWFLDGTYKLDGEKLLDAAIFYYKDC